VIGIFSRILIALLLLIAGVLKFAAVAQSDPPPHIDLGWMSIFFEAPFVIAAGSLEIGIAALLCTRAWRYAMLATLILSLLFLGFLLLLEQRGIGAEQCGCFGTARLGPQTHMLLLIGMSFAAAGSLLERRRR
jgi:hypothetical protein